jgi:hypothetical protein
MSKGRRLAQIGLDRLVRLMWLEQTSSLVLAGNTAETIRSILRDDLRGSFKPADIKVRGSLDKTITILQKVWIKVPSGLEVLHSAGLDLLKRLPRRDRIAVHWGMVMATYPFWAVVASQVGRLLRLQGSATAMHVQRRIREQYGERETVSRRTRYVLRSYVDWGVLSETSTKGVYKAGSSLTVKDSRLIAWMVEASLHTRTNGCAPPGDLFDSPGFFPFHLKPISALSILAASANLDMLCHGLNNDLVMLKKR